MEVPKTGEVPKTEEASKTKIDEVSKIEGEAIISDEVIKPKLSTMKYKIDPEMAYFPGNEGQNIKTLYDSFNFEEAELIKIEDETL